MKVRVENFQSIASAELLLDGLTVLVGPSDRGKSAVVRALQGALFNAPGEYFVRAGATFAVVCVEWSTGLDMHHHEGGHRITWAKGGGKNLFEIDGTTYSKVGVKAPEALKGLGFRDELIGARVKDDGTSEGGKWVRPQFSGQFDGIYLLDEQGTFINEVIVKLSRLGVLQRAERQCALDLRSAKSLLKTRMADLEVATTSAERLAPAPLLRTRLDALVTLDEDTTETKAAVQKLRGLLETRRAAVARMRVPLPALDPQRDTAGEIADSYRQLLTARNQLARRVLLSQLPKKLPKALCAPDGTQYKALLAAAARCEQLGQQIGARQMRLTALSAAETGMARATAKVHAAQEALNVFRASMPICPVCERPFDGASTPQFATAMAATA